MYKISVIVPVYNAENTLIQCIDSVINQSFGFENIELILVDDNSTDNSKNIIKDYANQYKNIKPIFLDENSGSPSKPRNIGIENSTAPYLIFLDNDDEFFNDYCEVLYNKIIEHDVNIVHCNHSSKLNNNIYIPIENINFEEETVNDSQKLFLKLTSWANIYNSSFIKDNNIQFPQTLYEDGVFYLHCLLKTNKPIIRLPNYPGYVYLIENDDSITHNISLNTLNRFLEGYKICGNLLKENNRCDSKEFLFNNFINMAIFILLKLDDIYIDGGIKALYAFEKDLSFDITLGSMPLNLINKKIMNQQFFSAKILLKSMSLFYNNRKIKNLIFVKFFNLKPLDEDL